MAEHPAPDSNADGAALRNWFLAILPTHDQEKVYTSDIKKIIKWYHILNEHGIIDDEIKARAERRSLRQQRSNGRKGIRTVITV